MTTKASEQLDAPRAIFRSVEPLAEGILSPSGLHAYANDQWNLTRQISEGARSPLYAESSGILAPKGPDSKAQGAALMFTHIFQFMLQYAQSAPSARRC